MARIRFPGWPPIADPPLPKLECDTFTQRLVYTDENSVEHEFSIPGEFVWED